MNCLNLHWIAHVLTVAFLQNYWKDFKGSHWEKNDERGKSIWSAIADPLHEVQHVKTNQWKPPGAGVWKVNADASFSAETGHSSVGVVVRGQTGAVALSICRRVLPCKNVDEAELTTIQVGLLELQKV